MENIRFVLEKVGIKPIEIEGAGCCPDPVYIQAYGGDTSLALSARNLALTKKKGDEVIVPCNGCYNVLEEARKKLKDPNLRKRINEILPDDLQYDGNIKIKHINEVLYDEIPTIKSKIERPLDGLKVAVHYGCHSLYPPSVYSDTEKIPVSMDKIVEALGAESIEYEGKLDCCGVSVIAFDPEEAYELLKNKLTNAKDADCIVTMCPGCFFRFDMVPEDLKDRSVPVIHLSELLALAMGIPEEKLLWDTHSTDVTPFLEKMDITSKKKYAGEELIDKYFDRELLQNHCEACSKECTAVIINRDTKEPFDPMEVVEKLNEGKIYEVLRSKEIWRCLQCGKCEIRCPHNAGLKEMFSTLRELSIKEVKTPRIMEDKMKILKETGYSVPARRGIRRKLGMDLAPEVDSKEIDEILRKLEKKKK